MTRQVIKAEARGQEDSQRQDQGGHDKASHREAGGHSGGGGGCDNEWRRSRQAESRSEDGSGV